MKSHPETEVQGSLEMLRFCLSSSAVQKGILEVLKSSLSSKLSWKPRTILTNSCLCWKDSSPSGNPQPAVLCGELVSGCFAGTHHPFSLPDNTQVSTYPCLSQSILWQCSGFGKPLQAWSLDKPACSVFPATEVAQEQTR